MPRDFANDSILATRRGPVALAARTMLGMAALTALVPLAGMSASTAGRAVSWLTPPEPEAIPRRWQLEIEAGPLRLASLDVPDVGKKTFFYLTYKVINNTGEDILFAPAFELATERGVKRSGVGVPVAVTKYLKDYVQNPYIQDQISIIGQLNQGKEFAKEGLVIWPADELSPDEMSVYAAGFSGETAAVDKPTTKDKTVKESVILRKSYQIKYKLSGDLTNLIGKEIEKAEPGRWIMR